VFLQGFKPSTPDYKSEALPLEPSCSSLFIIALEEAKIAK
jgi:hypothetical protein